MILFIQKTSRAHPKPTKQPINHTTLGQFYAVNVTLYGQVCMLELLYQPLKSEAHTAGLPVPLLWPGPFPLKKKKSSPGSKCLPEQLRSCVTFF